MTFLPERYREARVRRIVRQAGPTVLKEERESIPSVLLEHVGDRLGDGVVLRHGALLGAHPVMQVLERGTHQPVPGVGPAGDVQTVDLALNIGDGVDRLHGFKGDRRYVIRGLLLACLLLDVGKLEELPPGAAPTEGTEHRAQLTVTAIEAVVATVSIGLQDTLPSCEMTARKGHFPVAREVEQRGW